MNVFFLNNFTCAGCCTQLKVLMLTAALNAGTLKRDESSGEVGGVTLPFILGKMKCVCGTKVIKRAELNWVTVNASESSC